MVPQVRETREYEDDPHNSANRPAQPFGNWLFIWPWATHEGRIECAGSEPEPNGHESHEYLKYSPCQELLPPLSGWSYSSAGLNLSRFL
jgi:hypothetical protein